MTVNRSWGPRLVAAMVMIGAPVLWASTAWAQPSATVVFTGGCASEFVGPQTVVVAEPRETTIPAGATVRVLNRLGAAGTLSLDGEPAAELPAGAEVEVRVHAGTLTATMEIECPDGDSAAGSATVRTGPAGQAPSAAPPTGSSGDPGADGGDEADETPAPDPSPAASGPSGSAGPGAESTPGAESADATPEPVPASAGGRTGDQPNSALALVAAACVAGVLAAAIRAFAARRTTRTEWT
ncbi:MAG: hypothetical protein FWJ70_09630 [Micromonosporaceae bacterium]|jgi:hypothetical protein